MGVVVKEYVDGAILMASGKVRRMYEYVREKGTVFEGATHSSYLPRALIFKFISRAKFKDCYWNAQILTLLGGFRDIKYYEGVGYAIVPTFHAWNVYNGKVIDVTWEKFPREFPTMKLVDFQYFGVELPFDYVRRMNPIKKRVAEMLLPHYLQEIVGLVTS